MWDRYFMATRLVNARLDGLSPETFAVHDPALSQARFHLPHHYPRLRRCRLFGKLSASLLTARGELTARRRR